jgi:integrase
MEGDQYISIQTQKTGETVIIPCNPIVKQIFAKHGGKLPRPISNQKFNDYIKEVCREAGLTETGRLTKTPQKPLFDCISAHTARRSFATNMYLSGFPPIEIMKITGHRSEKTFLKYIRITKEETAKRMNAHIKKNWSKDRLSFVG